MEKVHAAIEAVSKWLARVGGFLLLAAALVISFEIIARKLFLFPFNVGTELSMYALATGASWSFSYALLRRAHVRVDVARRPLPQAGRCILDVAALMSLAVMASFLSYVAWTTAATSWALGARENTPLATPLVIPQGLWFLGIFWFALVAVEQTIMAATMLVRGRWSEVVQIAGPAGAEEEFEKSSSASVVPNLAGK